MYESMINSLKSADASPTSQILASQIEASERQAYEDEIHDLKEQRRRHYEDMVEKERDFGRQLSDKEGFMKDMQMQIERLVLEKSQQLFQWEVERKELNQRIQQAAFEREQGEAMIELRCQNRIKEVMMEIDRLKLEQMREVERVKMEYEHHMKDMRSQYEQEKQTLEFRLDRQSQDLKSLHHMVVQQDSATTDTKQSTMQHREQLAQELGLIQQEVDGIKMQYEQTVATLTKEKEMAEARNTKLQKQLEKLKNAPKQPQQIKIDLPLQVSDPNNLPQDSNESVSSLQRQVKNLKQEIELMTGENEKLTEQVKRLRKEALDMQEYAERLETNEKKLRQVLQDQATIEQEQVVELRRLLNVEKKRALEQSELMNQAKEQLENENYHQATIINEKEDLIRNLTRELRSHEQKIYDIQSMFNTGGNNNMNPLNISQTMSENLHQRHFSYQNNPLIAGTYAYPYGIAQSQNNFSPTRQHLNNYPAVDASYHLQVHQQQLLEGNINASQLGLTKQYSQSQLNNGLNQTIISNNQGQVPLLQNQILTQSVCLSSRSNNPNNLEQPQLIPSHSTQILKLPNYNQTQGQSSPRIIPKQQFAQNSRSFTCLLKEIDEEEEKNMSLPGSKLPPHVPRINLDQVSEQAIEQDGGNTRQSEGGSRKSRNNANGQPNKGGSTVNYAGFTSTLNHEEPLRKVNEPQPLRNSQSSLALQRKQQKAFKSNSSLAKSSISSKNSVQKSGTREKNANITNEIKDLLDKLVSYQGGGRASVGTSSSQHSDNKVYSSRQQNPMSADSLVELRSIDSSSIYVAGGQEFNKTVREQPKSSLGHNSSIQEQKGKSTMIPFSTKENSKKGTKKQLTVAVQDYQMSQESVKNTPTRNASSSGGSSQEDNDAPCVNRETAKHTSKDTIMTIPGRKRRGRRYHEVNKSDVITPNSPRRYQEYFHNKLNGAQHAQNNSYGGLTIPAPPTQQMHYYQNHRYSPSNTKSIADESQYHQLSPSPEKPQPKSKLNMNDERVIMPLQQQLQNQIGSNPSAKARQFATYDSGTVLCGGTSEVIFKTQSHKGHNLMFGVPLAFGATNSTYQRNSLDDESDIRPSQIDEFLEVRGGKTARDQYESGHHLPTSSYITIGDEDPFMTGKFCDNNNKQFNFKVPVKANNSAIPKSHDRKKQHNKKF